MLKKIKQVMEILGSRDDVIDVRIVGSYTRNPETAHDIDLLVTVDAINKKVMDELKQTCEVLGVECHVSPHYAYTKTTAPYAVLVQEKPVHLILEPRRFMISGG